MDESTISTAPRNPNTARCVPVLLAALLLFSGTAAATPEPAGRVISAGGEVTAVRAGESARSLARGDSVYEGDEIRTGRRGSVQVRFIDDGLVDLDAGTRFAIDRYSAGGDGSGGSVVVDFIRGALRTITGSIGGGADFYRMNTPTATLGVRGTGYALQYCDTDCVERIGVDSAVGLHGRVDEGVVTVDTPQGNAAFSAGEFFFVPEGSVPRVILKPPAGILDGGDGNGEGDDEPDGRAGVSQSTDGGDSVAPESGFEMEVSTAAGDSSAEPESGTDADPSDPLPDGGGGTILVGGSAATALSNGVAEFGAGQVLQSDPGGNVVGASFGSGVEVRVDGATLKEEGSLESLGVSWGRWEGSFTVDGVSATGNLAYTTVEQFTDPGTLASLSGTGVTYKLPLIPGSKNVGPSAFDQNDNLWSVNSLSFQVDFNPNDVVLGNLDLTGPGLITLSSTDTQNLTLDFSNNASFTIAANDFKDGGSMAATLTGKFVGSAAEGMVVNFQATDGVADVTGTAVLDK